MQESAVQFSKLLPFFRIIIFKIFQDFLYLILAPISEQNVYTLAVPNVTNCTLHNTSMYASFIACNFFFNFFNLRAGGEDSAFSNSSIILQLREQVSQLQAILQEKEESEKTSAQKLAMYQNQLHAKNNEVASLKDQLQAQVCLRTNFINSLN